MLTLARIIRLVSKSAAKIGAKKSKLLIEIENQKVLLGGNTMYKKALSYLVEATANNFFKERTKYKVTCAYKVELEAKNGLINFKAHICAADNDPKYGEYFTISGYVGCRAIVCKKIENEHTNEVLYDGYGEAV